MSSDYCTCANIIRPDENSVLPYFTSVVSVRPVTSASCVPSFFRPTHLCRRTFCAWMQRKDWRSSVMLRVLQCYNSTYHGRKERLPQYFRDRAMTPLTSAMPSSSTIIMKKVSNIDQHLAYIMCQAFDDCLSCELRWVCSSHCCGCYHHR